MNRRSGQAEKTRRYIKPPPALRATSPKYLRDLGEEGWGHGGSTTSKKKEILLNNIHGVDIDPQAVEVTKLSLLLKVLEGESQETIGSQLGMFKERCPAGLGAEHQMRKLVDRL